jgi:hypothetical protein
MLPLMFEEFAAKGWLFQGVEVAIYELVLEDRWERCTK